MIINKTDLDLFSTAGIFEHTLSSTFLRITLLRFLYCVGKNCELFSTLLFFCPACWSFKDRSIWTCI